MVNLFFQEFDQLTQLDQAGRMQDGRVWRYPGNDRWRSLVGPFSRQGDRALLFIEERKDFATSCTPHLEDEESFAPQRMKRVCDGRPSPRGVGAQCSLPGVSQR